MKPWVRQFIKSAARGIATFATLAWTAENLRRKVRGIRGQARSESNRLREELQSLMSRSTGYIDTAPIKDALATAPEAFARIIDRSREEEMQKKKKRWSFFKVILVLGILVAVAIFVLDKILPKPYRDEELDEAWSAGDGGLDEEDDTLSRPMSAEAVGEEDSAEEDEETAEEEDKKA